MAAPDARAAFVVVHPRFFLLNTHQLNASNTLQQRLKCMFQHMCSNLEVVHCHTHLLACGIFIGVIFKLRDNDAAIAGFPAFSATSTKVALTQSK